MLQTGTENQTKAYRNKKIGGGVYGIRHRPSKQFLKEHLFGAIFSAGII